MSEQQAEQTSEPGSLSGGPTVPNSSDAHIEPVVILAQASVGDDAPKVVPEPSAAATSQGEPKSEAPKSEALKTETGKVTIMLSADHGWGNKGAGAKAESEPNRAAFGNRRRYALAAVVALAAVAGALSGAMATSGFGHFFGNDAKLAGQAALEASVARIDADI